MGDHEAPFRAGEGVGDEVAATEGGGGAVQSCPWEEHGWQGGQGQYGPDLGDLVEVRVGRHEFVFEFLHVLASIAVLRLLFG